MAPDELTTAIEELAFVLDAQKDAAVYAHTQVQHTLAALRELVTLLRDQQTAATSGGESLRHRIGDLNTTLRRFRWKVLTIAGSLLLGACVIISGLIIASVYAERHRERRQYAHDTTIALGLDRYLTKTLDEALSAENRIAIDAIYAKAPAV